MDDVLIIGGGVIGCATARELARFDLRITLLERAPDIADGQSKANTAIVHAGYDAMPGTFKAKFNVLGNAMFERVSSELNVAFKRNTSLVIGFSKEDRRGITELCERGKENHVEGLRIIGAEQLRRLEPNVNPKATVALQAETAGIVNPYELTIAYAENAAENGVRFVRGAEVTGIERAEDASFRVSSSAGVFSARIVVNCAGVYADAINNMVSSRRLRIAPRRGEYYIVDKSHAGAFHASIFQLPSKMGKGVLVAPTLDGPILIGPTAEDIDDKRDTRTTAQGLKRALADARRTWPNLPAGAFITNYAGVRAHCEGDDFILGEAPDAEGFFNAAGIESPGLASSPAIAAYLAAGVASKLNAGAKPGFNPLRRAMPKFRDMDDSERVAAIARNPAFARIVCRCETVSEAEIREAIRRPVGAVTVDGVKRRTRAGMGRCQSGFCLPRVVEILSQELNIPVTEVTKCGGESRILTHDLFERRTI